MPAIISGRKFVRTVFSKQRPPENILRMSIQKGQNFKMNQNKFHSTSFIISYPSQQKKSSYYQWIHLKNYKITVFALVTTRLSLIWYNSFFTTFDRCSFIKYIVSRILIIVKCRKIRSYSKFYQKSFPKIKFYGPRDYTIEFKVIKPILFRYLYLY